MADSSEIDAAVVAKLSGDATLMALMTDGVYVDVAPTGKSKFVIVSLVIAQDEPQLGETAYEQAVYLVKAVERHASGATVKTAAARIHALLNYGSLTVTGYSHMLTRRVERIRYTEVDQVDQDIRWQHRGGRYEIFVSPS